MSDLSVTTAFVGALDVTPTDATRPPSFPDGYLRAQEASGAQNERNDRCECAVNGPFTHPVDLAALSGSRSWASSAGCFDVTPGQASGQLKIKLAAECAIMDSPYDLKLRQTPERVRTLPARRSWIRKC